MLANFIEATIRHSPIGFIPKGFTRLDELCRNAHIRYRDEPIVREEGSFTFRTWSILGDQEIGTDSYGHRVTGVAGHAKFIMLMDFLSFIHPDWTRESILNECLDQREPKVRELMSFPRRRMNEELVKLGVPNYSLSQALGKTKMSTQDLPDLG